MQLFRRSISKTEDSSSRACPPDSPSYPRGSSRFRGSLAGLVLLGVLVGLLPLTSPPTAHAGGFTIPLIGARASTRFAFVARPDDTSAVYHNPAGIGLLSEARLDLSGTGVLTHTTYYRCSRAFDENGVPGCYPGPNGELFEKPISTTRWGKYPKGFGILPFLGLSGRFGLKKWSFAFGIYSPHNATGSFPDCKRDDDGSPTDCSEASQRFDVIRGTVNTIYLTPTVAYQPHPAITLGGGVSAVRASIELKRAQWLGGPEGSAAVWWEGEGLMDLRATAWSYAFNLGFIWNLGETFPIHNPWLKNIRIGASYASQTSFDFSGKVEITSVPIAAFAQSCDVGDMSVSCRAKSRFRFPMVLRVGVDWELPRHGSLGVDVIWQNYTVYDKIHLRFPEPLVVELPGDDPITLSETREPKNSRDVVTVAVGGQWNVIYVPGLEVRAGFLWDKSPYPNATYSLLNPDADKMGLALGVSYRFKVGRWGRIGSELEVSAGYGALFYRDRVVRNSIIRPSICPAGDLECLESLPDADFSVNGDVKDKRVDFFVLQLTWRLVSLGGESVEPPKDGSP